ncbi:hypothetical protein Cni_G02346 [Canna indica]|uniref:RING-type E3 ubiquitin transferase n=1 Tax=Canna indica TaxID=4628 RepID=A0AAQ3JPY9_9LILI|nr:hypothetical protein Cni_G02346 [Canna indica]
MDEELVSRYWCHRCSQMVNPVPQADIKCPRCDSGFVEEMNPTEGRDRMLLDLGSELALSMWTPFLLGMLGGSGASLRRRRTTREEDGEEEVNSDRSREPETAATTERLQRSSPAILRLLQSPGRSNSGGADGERERVVFINPFNQAVIVQASTDANQSQAQAETNGGGGVGVAFGDYFLGPGLDLLLQQLTENDPSRYGTPPARKEAVEAMPTVKVEESSRCSVCLEDFEVGAEAREMPCKHVFHGECILSWLELHSSCPMCRFQLPADETKVPNADGNGGSNRAEEGNGGDPSGDDSSRASGRRFWVSWPFSGLFSLSSTVASQRTGNDSSSPTSSSPAVGGSEASES